MDTKKPIASLIMVGLSVLFPLCGYSAGVTVVTHGYQPYGTLDFPDWTSAMSQGVQDNISGTPTVYRITVTLDGIFYNIDITRTSGDPLSTDSGEIVVEINWAECAGLLGMNASAQEIAFQLDSRFVDPSFFPGLNKALTEQPLHFIGHSRGGVLLVHIATYLGRRGIWIDQVTTLDPHPVETGNDDLYFPMKLHQNVIFADNYYQNMLWSDIIESWPEGRAIDGAYYRFWWNPITDLIEGYPSGGARLHSNVHLWYHGTIDTLATWDWVANLTSYMRDNWYRTSNPNEERGAKTGFYFSRLKGGTTSGGTRPGSGLKHGSGDREPWEITATGAAVWDNIALANLETDKTVTQGGGVSLFVVAMDNNNDATIQIGLDIDANPYNGVYGSPLYDQPSTALTGTYGDSKCAQITLDTTGVPANSYYVYAKISNGTHTRYYYTKGRLIITAPGPQPTAINLTCNVSDSPVAPNYPITISGTANYNNSGGPVPAGTVNITVNGQTWTASISGGNYSKSIYAPSSPGSYTVSCSASDGLGRSGSASGSVTVDSNGGTSGYTISGFLTCKSADSFDPWMYYDEINAFGSDDAKFYVWCELTTITDAHRVDILLYRPDGTYYWGYSWNVGGEYGWWRGWVSWQINGYDIADIEGRWKAKLYVDGSYKRSIYFTLRYEFKEHRMTKGHNPSSPYDPTDETYTFTQTDQKAETWCKLDNVSNPLEMKWIFYEPNGSQYSETTYTSTDPNSFGYDYWGWYKFWGSIGIQGTTAANKCGDWRVEVFIKDYIGDWDQEYTDHFRIIENPAQNPSCSASASPEFPIETQSVTLNVSASDNTYLKSVILYWNDDTLHSETWDNIFASSLSQTRIIGAYSSGHQVEYWTVATDTSGNSFESSHYNFFVQPEAITVPSISCATNQAIVGQSVGFTVGGSSAALGGGVEYRFMWGDGQTSAWSTVTQATHSWSRAGTNYICAQARSQLRPSNVSGSSSNIQMVIQTSQSAPSVPTGVSASDGTYTNKVSVTWNASSGATGYEVWRNTSDNSGSASHLPNNPTATTYDDTSVVAGTTYYYWVKAKNTSGTSGFSSSDSGFRMVPTIYVSPTGSDANNGTSWALAKKTIQAGVDVASSGDMVLVTNGTYAPITIGKGITVRSVNGTQATIIDGGGATRCAYLNNTNVVLDGFTVMNGYSGDDNGGGVAIYGGTVQNCTICWNRAGSGSGVFISDGVVQNCTIYGNTASTSYSYGWGGGVYVFSGKVKNCTIYGNSALYVSGGVGIENGIVQNCMIYGNTSSNAGGGMYIWGGIVQNCTIYGNMATWAGGVGVAGGGTVQNCTISGNTAADYDSGGLYNFGTVQNCIVYYNENGDYYGNAPSYSCAPWLSGNGNITNDPQFVDSANGNYRLQATSPCINAGINQDWMITAMDLDGNARIQHGIVDMGAYESGFSLPGGTLQFSASSASVNENGGSVSLTVTRSGGSSGAASVNYATANGTASAGTDYMATSSQLNWADGNSDSKTITVPILNRSGTQGSRTFTVTLIGASGASLGSPYQATVTINDVGSSTAGTLQFSASSVSVNENAGSVSLTVTRSGDSSGAASVNYATANGSASAVTDYTTTSGQLNWADGNSDNQTITVPISDDSVVDGDKTFTVSLSSPSGASLGSIYSETVTIVDNESSSPPNPVLQPPTDVQASDGTYSYKVRIVWPIVTGATSYEVWRASLNVAGFAALLGEVGGLEYNDTTVQLGAVYYYWVKSKNALETSAFSFSDSGKRSVEMHTQPEVTINGASGEVALRKGDTLSVSIFLMATSALNADWWLVVAVPSGGWYYYDVYTGGWHPVAGEFTPTYQGALFDFLAPIEMLNMSTYWLPAGAYVFYFGVDTTMDGVLNDTLYYDSSTLNLVE